MKNTFEIEWTPNAVLELDLTINYLENNFSEKEIRSLLIKLNRILTNISINPKLFPISNKLGIRKCVIKKYNSMYYYCDDDNKKLIILSFYSNRQDPENIILDID